MKNKLYLIVGLILTYGILVTGVLAVATPNEREQSFIELGGLKERQSNLHDQADAKRAELETLKTEWQVTTDSIVKLESELF